MSTAYDDLRKYFVVDQSEAQAHIEVCDNLEDVRSTLSRRIGAGSHPRQLSVIYGEKMTFLYQQTLTIKFEGEGTDP
jgi:hypothetical protein